jgi:hypothetical protein
MNRKLSAVFLLLLLTQTIQASEIKAMLGMNSSKYLFTAAVSSLNSQQKTGICFGLGWAFSLSQNIELELNAFYRQGGAKVSVAYTPDQSVSGIYKNVSLALPIFLKYRFKTNNSPFIALGPEFVFLLSHHLLFPENGEDFDLSDNSKKFILAITAMLGYELPLGKWGLSAEIRYSRWLNNFLIDPETEARSESFALLLGGIYYL